MPRRDKVRNASITSNGKHAETDFNGTVVALDDVAPSNHVTEKGADQSEDDSDAGLIGRIQNRLSSSYQTHKKIIKTVFYFLALIAFAIYFSFALAHNFKKSVPLIVVTVIALIGVTYYKIVKVYFGKKFIKQIWTPLTEALERIWDVKAVRWITGISAAVIAIGLLIYDTRKNPYRLVSLGGLVFYIAFCFLVSTNPAKVVWRPVIWGLILQFLIGFLVLRWSVGLEAIKWLSENVVKFLEYSQKGAEFVYGFLATPPNICGMTPVFAFSVMQTLLYFGGIISVLYYFGIMQYVLKQMAFVMQITLGTTAAESLNAAGCVFLGMTEAPLMIRPYLSKMTRSELHTVFASGFSCIAGSLLIAYISFGACSQYLLSASVMSAPTSLAISKLLLPETEQSQLKRAKDLKLPKSQESNVIEALSVGATVVVDVIAQILANLIVFIAVLAFIDNAIWWFGDLIGADWSFQKLIGYVFFPLAFIMGASDASDWGTRVNETMIVAELMGTKTVLNEFIAYQKMGTYVANNAISARAQMIATFALCGFSNFGSIGIQMGTFCSMCPEKKSVISEVMLRALLAGSVTCFMTACVAGILVDQPLLCPPKFGGGSNCTHV